MDPRHDRKKVARVWQFYRDGGRTRTAAHGEQLPVSGSTLLIKNGTYRVTPPTCMSRRRARRTATDQRRSHLARDVPGRPRPIDATAGYLLPGGIDVHTHLDMPFGGDDLRDDFESGDDRGGSTAARRPS
jgi:hypothetical protein